ncbi:MAG: alanine--glyoxylate aminotransferase family protein [Phycisphaeraceae bacterium]|nr:alanine--glyoxylate aminotransferase family protein [Phycisphaeraceae bacterium]
MPADAKIFFKQRVMTPGPTDVPPAVLLEMAQPIIHHRTKQFQAIFVQMTGRLANLFRTKGTVLTLAGSGTTAFESAMISLAKPGSKVITIAGGKFGERWQDIYDQYAPSLQVENIKINVPWGQAVTAQQVADALAANPTASVVALVHSETSTATACDLKAIAQVVSKSNAVLIADSITGVGALPMSMDEWGVDCVVTGSQKALMLPPGLGFVALGARAQERLKEVKAGAYYNLDLRRWVKAMADNDLPFTAPVSLIRGQNVALELIEKEGLETIWGRVAKLATASRAAFAAMGLKLISASPSDSVTGVFYPAGVEDSKFRGALRDKYGLHVAGGQDGRGAKWKTSILRISHMGYVDAGDTLAVLAAIEAELRTLGQKIDPGCALAAAAKVLAG